MSHGNYIEHFNDTFNNMYYIEEEKRGFFPEENHCVPGRYEIEIEENSKRQVNFICSLEENIEETNVQTIINKETIRINNLIKQTELIDKKVDIKNLPEEEKEKFEIL